MTTNPVPLPAALIPRSRTDTRMALVVDLALAILESSGRFQAAQYLHASGVPLYIAVRVLAPDSRRRKSEH